MNRRAGGRRITVKIHRNHVRLRSQQPMDGIRISVQFRAHVHSSHTGIPGNPNEVVELRVSQGIALTMKTQRAIPTLGQTGALPGAPVTPGTPLFGAPGTPTFGMPGSVTFGAVGSFTFGCPGSPTFGMAGSPTFGALGSATYGMLKSKKMNGKRVLTPVYSAPSAPPPMKSSAMRAAQQAALVNNEADPIFL